MTNSYCENKSKKPVITKYDPSKNYMVQMVESLASIDYPNENHIYVIESTGEKYIFYNGAFSKVETLLQPLDVSVSVSDITHDSYNYYSVWRSTSVTFSKTYEEIKEALENGIPIVITYSDLAKTCTALEIDSDTIALSVFDAFLDVANGIRYRTETFTIKSDNTGIYAKSLVVMSGLDILIGNQ